MARHASFEARILDWFENASTENANTMLGILRHRLKARENGAASSSPKPVVKRRRRRVLAAQEDSPMSTVPECSA